MQTLISNWTSANKIEVSYRSPHDTVPPLVGMCASYGPLSLHFCMTADQARQMAASLMLYAAEVDKQTVVA